MYTLGRAMAIQTAGLTGPLDAQAKAQAEAERDAHIRDAFVNTLMPVGANEIADVRATAGNDADEMIAANAQAQHILARVLMILQVGLQVYDPTQATHVDFKTGDVVRALPTEAASTYASRQQAQLELDRGHRQPGVELLRHKMQKIGGGGLEVNQRLVASTRCSPRA